MLWADVGASYEEINVAPSVEVWQTQWKHKMVRDWLGVGNGNLGVSKGQVLWWDAKVLDLMGSGQNTFTLELSKVLLHVSIQTRFSHQVYSCYMQFMFCTRII